jgi:undecaprenyl pyrophosphate phosphatase UppP
MIKYIITVLYGILFFSMRDKILSFKSPSLTVSFAIVGGLGVALIEKMFEKYQKSKKYML